MLGSRARGEPGKDQTQSERRDSHRGLLDASSVVDRGEWQQGEAR